jgi:hypothetical protein
MAEARRIMAPAVLAARQKIESLAPHPTGLMQAAAQTAREMERQLRAAGALPAPQRVDAEKLAAIEDQERQMIHAAWTVMAVLRQDANKQNQLAEQDRQRARDADDAIAALRAGVARTIELLAETNKSADPASYKAALVKAADSGAALTRLLEQLTAHYTALRDGKDAGPTRQALRGMEEDLGNKEELDADYARLARLAELTVVARTRGTAELMKELEKDLNKDLAMQRELEQVARNALRQALAELNASAQQQQRLSETLHDVALARRELTAELTRQLGELQSQIGTLANQQLPALVDAIRADKVELALKPLQNIVRAARQAVSSAPPAKDDLKLVPRHLADQAKALDQTAQEFADAAAEVDAVTAAQSRPALEQARKAAAEVAAALEKYRALAVAAVEADDAAKAAAEQAQSSGDPAEQKTADKAVVAAKAAHQAADAAQQQVAMAGKAVQNARRHTQESRKTLDALLAQIAATRSSAQTLSQQAAGLAKQIERATADAAGSELAPALHRAAAEQRNVAARVEAAAVLAASAAEHQRRLDHGPAGKPVDQRVTRLGQLVAGEMLPTAEKMAALPTASAAQAAVDGVAQSIRNEARLLESLAFPATAADPSTAATGDDDLASLTPREAEVARQLVRAIDLTANAAGGARQAVAAAEQSASAERGKPPTGQPSPAKAIDEASGLIRGQGNQFDAAGLAAEKTAGYPRSGPGQNQTKKPAPTPDAEAKTAQERAMSAAKRDAASPNAETPAAQNNPAKNPSSTPDPEATAAQERAMSAAKRDDASLAAEESLRRDDSSHDQSTTPDAEATAAQVRAMSAAKLNTASMADAAKLFDVAARANSRKMVQQRSDVPQEKPTQNTKNGTPKGTLQALQRAPDTDLLKPLRTKVAKDLAEGEQETVPEADRAAIEAYFRAVAKETAAAKSDGTPGDRQAGAPPGPSGPRPRKQRSK